MKKSATRHSKCDAFADEGMINVIIETPKGSRNKFQFDPRRRGFTLHSVLPAGADFPYDFGFVPDTKAADGDPLDVLLLMDESAFPGCLVVSRVVGVIEAEQSEDGRMIRNDRIIAVAHDAHDYRDVRSLKDLNHHLLRELEHFFVSYNQMRGKKFKLLALRGPKRARKLVQQSARTNGKRPIQLFELDAHRLHAAANLNVNDARRRVPLDDADLTAALFVGAFDLVQPFETMRAQLFVQIVL